MLFPDSLAAIGSTPLVRLGGQPDGVEVFAKLELQNLYAMKDRVARQAICTARDAGILRAGDPIIESSSGTMALGVALVGRFFGHPVHIVTDPRIDAITLAKLRALGCEMHIVEAMTGQGWQSARLERLEHLRASLPGAFWPRQYSNPDNPRAYRALADELVVDLGRIDILVGSVGSGGSLCGTSRALRGRLPGLRVVGVDCVGSFLFDQPDRPGRLQSGLGNSLLPANLDRGLIAEVHWLNDHEAFAATRRLVAEQQIFAGNTSGSVYQVLCHLAGRAEPGTRIVGVLPDRGDRYVDTVYSDEYWSREEIAEQPRRRVPEAVTYGTVVSAWSYAAVPARDDRPRSLLFLEANTTGSGMRALHRARGLAVEPVFLTSRPDRYPGLAETGCRILTCDTNSLVALRRVIEENFRREDLAGVTTTSDFYTTTAARLADWLTFPGNPPEAVAACRDKSMTRRVLGAAGVRQPAHGLVTDLAGLPAEVRRTGLPCVVKPVDDSGSRNVRLCHTLGEAREQAERILAVRRNVRDQPAAAAVLVEEYLPGAEYSVEMFGTGDESVLVGITRKTTGPAPYFVEERHLFPAPLSAEVAADVTATVRRALAAIGFRDGASHTEVRLTATGAAVIEVNPRPAGGMIPELIRHAVGVDLLHQQLRAALGLPVDVTGEPRACSGIHFLTAPRAGALRGVDGAEEARSLPGVTAVVVTAEPGRQVRPAQDAYDRLGYIIATAVGPAEVTAALDKALELVTVTVDAAPGAPPENQTQES